MIALLSALLMIFSPVSGHKSEVRQTAVYVTAYAAADNDPPGSRTIACPVEHRVATSDLGTYANPVTVAAATKLFPCGMKVYIPYLRKYGVIEDECAECRATSRPWIDVYISSSRSWSKTARCEAFVTGSESGNVVYRNAAPGHPVDAHAFMDSNYRCYAYGRTA